MLKLWLRLKGLALYQRGEWSLTDRGRILASDIIRRHRRYEGYLHEELKMPVDHVHRPAHDVEHFLDDTVSGTEEVLVKDRTDPHGSQIPERLSFGIKNVN